MRRVARRGGLLAALVLSACASVAPPPSQGWSGKLGYRVEASPGQRAQAGSALFELSGDAGTGQLRLSSPLGTLLTDAQWGPQGVLLRGERGDEQRYASLEALGAALGDSLQSPPLPLAALFDWLHGQPSAAAPHRRSADGFEQLGWHVSRSAQGLVLTQGGTQLRMVLSP